MVSFNHYINPIQTKGLFIIYGREGAGDFVFRGRQKLVPPPFSDLPKISGPPSLQLAKNKWPPPENRVENVLRNGFRGLFQIFSRQK